MRTLLFITLSLLVAAQAPAADRFDEMDFLSRDDLPQCWTWMSSYHAADESMAQASGRFGVPVKSVDVVELYAGDTPLDVTAYRMEDDAAADAALEALSAQRPAWALGRDGDTVYEFRCDNRYAVSKVKRLLGVTPRLDRVWKVTMEIAPEYRGDDRYWNALYDVLQDHHENPDNEAAIFTAIDLSPRFQFTNELLLFVPDTPWGTPQYTFSTEPVSREVNTDELKVTFGELPRVVDVPRVTVTATIPTRSYATYAPDYEPDLYRLTLKTDPFPWTHGEIQRRLKQMVRGDWPVEQKLEEILCWVHFVPELDTMQTAGRYGTLEALRQNQAFAWDKSDIFISMARFLEIPTRQVYGWLEGHGPHVWARVYAPDSDLWVDVDPTFGWFGVSEEYIPLFVSDIGHPPFVFTKTPEIELVSESVAAEE